MSRTAVASRTFHPARHIKSQRPSSPAKSKSRLEIPLDANEVTLDIDGKQVRLTNLNKLFWRNLGLTKRDLLQYYADISPWLLPHVHDRAMVMKRYPNGIDGEFFFMKRAPTPRPEWIEICSIAHGSGNIIGFPVIQDLAALMWVVNLGCIDLNPWYARCDDVDRPDYLHFDLDPFKGAKFEQALETALLVRDGLTDLGIPCYAKTTGSRGIHVYVPIVRGPIQKQVWTFAKQFAKDLATRHPKLMTTEYRIEKRPARRIVVDYNQNAWGRTLASIYSVRPHPKATVSTPVTWREIEKGIRIEDFRVDNVVERTRKLGDLWEPLLFEKERFRLEALL